MIFQIFAYLILLPSYFKYTLPHPRSDPPILDLVKYLKNSVLRSFVKLANPIDCNTIKCWIQVATVLKATEVIYSRLDNEWQRRLEINIPKWGFAEIGGLQRHFGHHLYGLRLSRTLFNLLLQFIGWGHETIGNSSNWERKTGNRIDEGLIAISPKTPTVRK